MGEGVGGGSAVPNVTALQGCGGGCRQFGQLGEFGVQGGGGGGTGLDLDLNIGFGSGAGRKSPCAAFGCSLYNGHAGDESNQPGRGIGMRRPFNSRSNV